MSSSSSIFLEKRLNSLSLNTHSFSQRSLQTRRTSSRKRYFIGSQTSFQVIQRSDRRSSLFSGMQVHSDCDSPRCSFSSQSEGKILEVPTSADFATHRTASIWSLRRASLTGKFQFERQFHNTMLSCTFTWRLVSNVI
ncbi:hypothetical protein OIU84_000463 [Salix udensis]|uniref:Uncharacterized protein n=1 Tax=Salix udensis TaxID=889485 RepID=A0AAD6L4T4_9ROSI|nr:hypothetical protein OIU84_000463 [Salix udensis]